MGLGLVLLPLTATALRNHRRGLPPGLRQRDLVRDRADPGRGNLARVGRAQYLGGWRLCADLGNTLGPLIISAIAARRVTGGGLCRRSAAGRVGAVWLARLVPRYAHPGRVGSGRQTPRPTRAGNRRVARVSDLLVWMDCEMTGLDLEHDELVEVAALVTDGELNVLGEGVDILIKPSQTALDQMGDFVREMHTASGSARRAGRRTDDGRGRGARARLHQGVRSRDAQGAAGRQHHRHRPGIPGPADADSGAHVHYRNVDVSSIKELVRRWYPRAYYSAPAKPGNHRALADVQESIEELRYYRDAVFVPLPGPGQRHGKSRSRPDTRPR